MRGSNSCVTHGLRRVVCQVRASENDDYFNKLAPFVGAVSQVVGYIKSKSAIHLARVYGERKRNFVGQSFWARGYFVSTVGRDEEVNRNYIRHQEKEDEKLERMGLWK